MTDNKQLVVPGQSQYLTALDPRRLRNSETGYVIGARDDNDELIRLATDKHMISIAGTRGGKGVSVAIPNLLTHEGSVFSVEIGGATYHETHNVRRHRLNQRVHVIDPFGATGTLSSHINLLMELDPAKPTFATDCGIFASSILKDEGVAAPKQDYFVGNPRSLLKAFLLYVRTSPDVADEERHLPHVAELMSTYGTPEWDQLMRRFSADRTPNNAFLKAASNYFSSSRDANSERNENRDSIQSSVNYALEFARDPAIAAISRDSTFSLSQLRSEKTSVYVVMPEIDYFQAHIRWIRLLVERGLAACPNLGDGGRSFTHNDRVLFMLDEFTQLGKLDAVDTGMQTAAQKGITLWAMFQDLSRLNAVYGEELAQSFLSATGAIQIFKTTNLPTLRYASERLGKEWRYMDHVQHGTSSGQTRQTSQTSTLGDAVTLNHGDSQTTAYKDSWSTNSQVGGSSGWNAEHGNNNSRNWSSGTTVGGDVTESFVRQASASATSNRSQAQGTTMGVNTAVNDSITKVPHHVSKLEPSEIAEIVSTRDRQLVFADTGTRLANVISRRAIFTEIPELRQIAHGPEPVDASLLGGTAKLLTPPEYSMALVQKLSFPEVRPKESSIDKLRSRFDLTLREPSLYVPRSAPPPKRSFLDRLLGRYPDPPQDATVLRAQDLLRQTRQVAPSNMLTMFNGDRTTADFDAASSMDLTAQSLGVQYAVLRDARATLEQKVNIISEFEDVLVGYQAALQSDRARLLEYPDAIERYTQYLQQVIELREKWSNSQHVIPVPTRPNTVLEKTKAVPNSPELTVDEINDRIDAPIRRFGDTAPTVDRPPTVPPIGDMKGDLLSDHLRAGYNDTKIASYKYDSQKAISKVPQTAGEIGAFERRMDQHWNYLEVRCEDLNGANIGLEILLRRGFNRVASLPEWDRLERQTRMLTHDGAARVPSLALAAPKGPSDPAP